MNKAFLFLVIIILSCKNQNLRSEADFMECVNSKYSDTELDIQDALFDHEIYLASKGFIDDNSGKSYIQLIKNIADKKINITDIKQTFSISTDGVNLDFEDCGKFFVERNEKIKNLKEISTLLLENESDVSDLCKKLHSIVEENDFKYEFYKMYTFVIIDYYILGINK